MAKINKTLFGEVAVSLQSLIEDEAEAIKGYQEKLNQINNLSNAHYLFMVYDDEKKIDVQSPTAVQDKKMCKLIADTYKHYIAEEIKHLKGLQSLYEVITGIKSDVKY